MFMRGSSEQSTAAAMPDHPTQLDQGALLADCDVRRQRRSGPGGQHRNKVQTGVFLVHRATGIRGEATEKRSQQQNLHVAVERLRVNLALEIRQGEIDHSPSQLWRSRLRNRRLVIRLTHRDFAILLAEALDVLAHYGWQPRPAAAVEQDGNHKVHRRHVERRPAGVVIGGRNRGRGTRPTFALRDT